jgi:hypothetical protein
MNVTPFQYKVMKLYWRYHTSGFTAGQILRRAWKQWAILIGCSLIAYLLFSPSSPALGCLAVGLFCGAIFRDIGHYRVALRLWPLNHEIYDWKKVAEIIEAYENNVA